MTQETGLVCRWQGAYTPPEMRILSATFAKLTVVLALLIAMAGTGFAHRAIPLDVDEDLISYLAAGGTLAEICGDASGETVPQSCDACRLVDAAAVPPSVGDGTHLPITRPMAVVVPAPICASASLPDRTYPARAPPVV